MGYKNLYLGTSLLLISVISVFISVTACDSAPEEVSTRTVTGGKQNSANSGSPGDTGTKPAPVDGSTPTNSGTPPTDTGGVDDGKTNDPSVPDHTNLTTNCIKCHDDDKPSDPHYGDQPCELCHEFDSGFATQKTFLHTPAPEKCDICHTKDKPMGTAARAYPTQGQPPSFNADDQSEGSGHYSGNDCVKCHQTPQEGATKFVWDHGSKNPGICLPCHFKDGEQKHDGRADVVLDKLGNCNTCHENFDRSGTRNFDRTN